MALVLKQETLIVHISTSTIYLRSRRRCRGRLDADRGVSGAAEFAGYGLHKVQGLMSAGLRTKLHAVALSKSAISPSTSTRTGDQLGLS